MVEDQEWSWRRDRYQCRVHAKELVEIDGDVRVQKAALHQKLTAVTTSNPGADGNDVVCGLECVKISKILK